MERTFVFIGAIAGFFGVALGAFAAHGLRDKLPPEMLAVFETGVRYQMFHALALILVGALAARIPGASGPQSVMATSAPPMLRVAGWAFLAGIVLFSGSLYALAFTGVSRLGMITPLGGVAFLVGWACLAFSML